MLPEESADHLFAGEGDAEEEAGGGADEAPPDLRRQGRGGRERGARGGKEERQEGEARGVHEAEAAAGRSEEEGRKARVPARRWVGRHASSDLATICTVGWTAK